MRTALILIAALLAGCAQQSDVPEPQAEPPAAIAHSAPAKPRPAPATPFITPPRDSPDAVVRDTDALRDQATAYVVRRDSDPFVIDRLSVATLRARKAAERAHRTKRASDVAAARAAADALAALIQARTQAP